MTSKKIIAKFFTITLSFLILLIIVSFVSSPEFDCSKIRTGTFFQYKNGNQLYSTVIRQDTLQTEINSQTGDTSYWKIHWTDNCTFSCNYISGFKSKSKEELDFYNQSTLVFKVKTMNDEYYNYDAELKFKSQSMSFSDTLWRQRK